MKQLSSLLSEAEWSLMLVADALVELGSTQALEGETGVVWLQALGCGRGHLSRGCPGPAWAPS